MGPSEVYTTFELEGHPASAAYTLNKQQAAQGVPPHWASYIAVESADATAARVPGLGGKVILPPFDVASIFFFAHEATCDRFHRVTAKQFLC